MLHATCSSSCKVTSPEFLRLHPAGLDSLSGVLITGILPLCTTHPWRMPPFSPAGPHQLIGSKCITQDFGELGRFNLTSQEAPKDKNKARPPAGGADVLCACA